MNDAAEAASPEAGAYGRTTWRNAAGLRNDDSGDRKEREVRSMLDLVHPAAPPDLADRAMARGLRLLRLRRARDIVLWLLLIAALVGAGIAAAAYAHSVAPLRVTPPISGP